MQDRIDRVLRGFQILTRLNKADKIYPCYICSPASPQFGKGWEVRLDDDDEVVLIGKDCGKRHLSQDYTAAVRDFEALEWRAKLEEARAAYQEHEKAVRSAAENTRSDPGLQAIVAIKQAVLELHPRARKILDAAAVGAVSGVRALSAFGHGNPRGSASDVLENLDSLLNAKFVTDMDQPLRNLRKAIQEHNDAINVLGNGRAGLTTENLKRLNSKMPEVDIKLAGEQIVLERRDGLRRTLPLPPEISLIQIPSF